MENMVENQAAEVAADDAQLNTSTEEVDTSESIESVLTEAEEAPKETKTDADTEADTDEPAEEETKGSSGTSEPGWIKKRVNSAVAKAVAETERRMRAEFDQQLAPFREQMLNDQAKELVRQGEFKSLDRAKEYLQLKQGITPTPQAAQNNAQQKPQNEQGQLTAKNGGKDPTIEAKAQLLAKQAEKIKNSQGIDVMEAFKGDEEIQKKVFTGEWDFYDVAASLKENGSKKKSTAPMRSPNGASGNEKSSIASMSDEQFKRMEKRISEGTRYKV